MANYSTSEFKSGLKILIDGDPYAIVASRTRWSNPEKARLSTACGCAT